MTSLSFLESGAILIDLSFFTVITAGLTDRSSAVSVTLSRYQFSSLVSVRLLLVLVKALEIVVVFAVKLVALFSSLFLGGRDLLL